MTTATAALAELRREKAYRERVFPRWVEEGRMTRAAMASRMSALDEAIRIVERAASSEQLL